VKLWLVACIGLARRPDWWDLAGHSSQHLGNVPRFDRPPLARQLAGDVEQTSQIAGQHGVGAGQGDVVGLVADHLVRDFRVFSWA
jgi:hypothetical protein